jgi:hypothetical protein
MKIGKASSIVLHRKHPSISLASHFDSGPFPLGAQEHRAAVGNSKKAKKYKTALQDIGEFFSRAGVASA